MMKPADYSRAMQDVLSNLPVDTSSFRDALRTQTALGEKLSRVALEAAERSTEVSSRWAKDTIARLGELSTAKDEPADYTKAMSDFATAAAELAAEHMAAYAEIAKKVQMETVDLMLTAGKDIAADAQTTAQSVAENVSRQAEAASRNAQNAVNAGKNADSAKS